MKTIIVFAVSGISSQAVQSPDGTVAFESAVLLVDTYTTFSGIRVRQAIYYFDLELPSDVGESLQKVVIKQRTGGDEIKFEPDKTKAYLGDHNDKQEQLNTTNTYNETTGEVTIQFNQPIAPGNKLTIGLKPRRNPDLGGVYLFGVTAFPSGKKPVGLYLGAGRLNFEQSDSFDI
ncbi:MAG: DUF2808 domain-containing protein [Waterburya sp.]